MLFLVLTGLHKSNQILQNCYILLLHNWVSYTLQNIPSLLVNRKNIIQLLPFAFRPEIMMFENLATHSERTSQQEKTWAGFSPKFIYFKLWIEKRRLFQHCSEQTETSFICFRHSNSNSCMTRFLNNYGGWCGTKTNNTCIKANLTLKNWTC